MPYPQRIVCLTEETTETLYLLGEGDRVVGVSGYTVRPPEARQKPRISSFLHARFDAIEALEPDLILAFSDLQAEVTRELVARGHMVVTFNQRSVDDILEMICMLGGIVGRADRAEQLASQLGAGLDRIREQSRELPRRPRVYFEEWDGPLISGIEWVEELVEIAGGTPIFPELRHAGLAKDRIVTQRGGRAARSRGDRRVVVRQARAARGHRRPSGLGCHQRRRRRTHLRDQVSADPAAGAGGIDGWRAGVARRDSRGSRSPELGDRCLTKFGPRTLRSAAKTTSTGGIEALLGGFAQQAQHGGAPALAVVERQVVHVHADESVGARAIEAAAVLHRVRDRVAAMRRGRTRCCRAADATAARSAPAPGRGESRCRRAAAAARPCARPTTRRSRRASAALPARR